MKSELSLTCTLKKDDKPKPELSPQAAAAHETSTPKGSTPTDAKLLIGDSMIGNVNARGLSETTVKCHRGAKIESELASVEAAGTWHPGEASHWPMDEAIQHIIIRGDEPC